MASVDEVTNRLELWRQRFRRAQVRWSAIHFASAYGGAIMAAVASVLAGVEAPPTLTATTAATAAALAATTRIGRFEEKWRSARLARGRIDGLLNDVVKHEPDLDAILDELTEVVQTHDDIIVKPMSALAG